MANCKIDVRLTSNQAKELEYCNACKYEFECHDNYIESEHIDQLYEEDSE